MNYLIISGLALDVIGAIVIALPLLMSKEEIKKRSQSGFDINDNIVTLLIKDRKKAIIGLTLLVLGFIIQILGNIIT